MSIAALRRFVKQPDCVIFVGSGISTWSGLPSWSGVLHELANFLDSQGLSSDLVRREIVNGDLLQAASFGISKLTPAAFATFMRSTLRVGLARPHAIHKAIVELGPTSFVTTNYDTLIEQALNTWRSDVFFSAPITNKHLVELVEIVSARSSHFIFKPHGDIGDTSSLVLTREQYRALMPGGERNNALESLKTLLVTRPIIYLGFGLRDPDFLYLRDLLLNIYQGSVRDHWAIMADIDGEEAEYWRSSYGIKLLGYKTHNGSNGQADHGALLPILLELKEPADDVALSIDEKRAAQSQISDAEKILALTRYSSGLMRRLSSATQPVDVRISRRQSDYRSGTSVGSFAYWTTLNFLTSGPQRGLLVGSPGSGKSFSIRLATYRLAEKLNQACLDDTLNTEHILIPIFVDLKLYKGDLVHQIEKDFPALLSLRQISSGMKIKVLFDAFNEMGSEYIEGGNLFRDIEKFREIVGEFDFVITSRTTDGIPDVVVGENIYEIDSFDEHHVNSILAEHKIALAGNSADDVKALLSHPFYLQLLLKGLIDAPRNGGRRDVYESFFVKLQRAFEDRFGSSFSLLSIFAKIAYRAIDDDSEAFPVSWLTDTLFAQSTRDQAPAPVDIANWLVSREVLVPYSGKRASFVHQSLTEYCAAGELAIRLELGLISLREVIASKKWDQCLFLAISMLPKKLSEKTTRDLIGFDLGLAINAARFVEEGQSTVVSRILNFIADRPDDGNHRSFFFVPLRGLPASSEHIPLLLKIMKKGGAVAAEATQLAAKVFGTRLKPKLIDLLAEHADDYNFATNGIAPVLSAMLDENDFDRITQIAYKWAESNSDISTALGKVLSAFETDKLINWVKRCDGKIVQAFASFVGSALYQQEDLKAFRALAALVISYPEDVTGAFALALQKAAWENDIDKAMNLDHRHVDSAWEARHKCSIWDTAIVKLCELSPHILSYVLVKARQQRGIEEIALNFCAGVSNENLLSALKDLLSLSDLELVDEPFEIFDLTDLDWRNQEDFLIECFIREIPRLRRSLTRGSIRGLRARSVSLDKLLPLFNLIKVDRIQYWEAHRLGIIIAVVGTSEVREYLLNSLTETTRLSDWVKREYIRHVADLTIDSLEEDMVSSLLAELNIADRIDDFFYNPIGHLATEQFVEERLLPLAKSESEPFRNNLKKVLEAVGERHGKRYLLPAK